MKRYDQLSSSLILLPVTTLSVDINANCRNTGFDRAHQNDKRYVYDRDVLFR